MLSEHILSDDEISKLLEYAHFQKWDTIRRKKIILMISDSKVMLDVLQDEEKIKDFKSWDLKDFIKKLDDSDKEKLLNLQDWFENHGFTTYETTQMIIGINESTKYSIMPNPNLMEKLQLKDYNVTRIIASLNNEESKEKLLDIYKLA